MQVNRSFYIILIIVLTLALVAVALSAYFTNGFAATPDGSSIGSIFGGSSAKFELSTTKIRDNTAGYQIDVKNGGNYTVEIIQNNASNFEYFIDEIPYQFLDSSVDWSAIFELEVNETGFSLNTSKQAIQEVLLKAHGGTAVTNIGNFNISSELFDIFITSEQGEIKLIPLDTSTVYIITDMYISDSKQEVYLW